VVGCSCEDYCDFESVLGEEGGEMVDLVVRIERGEGRYWSLP